MGFLLALHICTTAALLIFGGMSSGTDRAPLRRLETMFRCGNRTHQAYRTGYFKSIYDNYHKINRYNAPKLATICRMFSLQLLVIYS